MKVLMFQPRFARLVEQGLKRQTIRAKRRNPIQVGDILSLREWMGEPYASVQKILGSETCKEIHIVEAGSVTALPEEDGVYVTWFVDGEPIPKAGLDAFAQADGFKNYIEMFNWFLLSHKFPFKGTLIKW